MSDKGVAVESYKVNFLHVKLSDCELLCEEKDANDVVCYIVVMHPQLPGVCAFQMGKKGTWYCRRYDHEEMITNVYLLEGVKADVGSY